MNEGFLKFKRRLRKAAMLKACAFGLLCGMAVGSVLVILFKRGVISLPVLVSCAIGALVALVSGLAAAIIFLPSDKKIAVLLDNEFSLGESVQTMLAYKDESGMIIDIQRREAEADLGVDPLCCNVCGISSHSICCSCGCRASRGGSHCGRL